MKINKIMTACVLAVAASAVIFMAVSVSAEDSSVMTDEQISLIKTNCSSTKLTLNQLHSSDALLRVNRGQIYESIYARLMNQFNVRVASNSLNNTGLTAVSNSYESLLDTFRADYIIYEQQLSLAISIDCSKQPVSFYDAVVLAKNYRSKVHQDITALNSQISQYQTALSAFSESYKNNPQSLK
jgi:hypothetical protein